MSSGRQPRRPRCGDWSTSASMPGTCRGFVRPGPLPEQGVGGRSRPDTGAVVTRGIDATLVIDHSDNKAGAAPTWKKTFGHHPLLAFVDRPEIAGGEPLAGLLRPGNAGSNTAADHIVVLDQALASLPVGWRPHPVDSGDSDAPRVLVRCDSAGATHAFAAACRRAGVGFSFGH